MVNHGVENVDVHKFVNMVDENHVVENAEDLRFVFTAR
jgi:hypothetical protein